MQKIMAIKQELMGQYQERDEVIEGLLIGLIARQHSLLIGPPGTGKSALVADLSERLTGANYFQWLLTRFSTPEELFGPVSLQELERGIYKRNTAGKLPEAHTAFLDEIFKSNSAILNSLLTLINERQFYNNGGAIQTPLISIIGSSNEYPEEGEGLEALFDRFLIRFEVDYVSEEKSFIQMLNGSTGSSSELLTLNELQEVQFFSDMVTIPEEVYHALSQIRNELFDEGIRPSDRRFKQSLSVIQARATLAGRQQAIVEDVLFLKNSLWETADQKNKVASIVEKHASDVVSTAMKDIYDGMSDILQNIKSDNSSDHVLEAIEKIKYFVNEIKELKKKYPDREEVDEMQKHVEECLEKLSQQAVGI